MDKIKFEYPEDYKYFKKLLCSLDELLEKYSAFFDFRHPKIKRSEFNKINKKVREELINRYGKKCMLRYPDKCTNTDFVVDHLIPLSSNKLNKLLRNIKAEKGKKVLTQSFGSNNMDNLIIACTKCNLHKKHIILKRDKIQQILELKFKPPAQLSWPF